MIDTWDYVHDRYHGIMYIVHDRYHGIMYMVDRGVITVMIIVLPKNKSRRVKIIITHIIVRTNGHRKMLYYFADII